MDKLISEEAVAPRELLQSEPVSCANINYTGESRIGLTAFSSSPSDMSSSVNKMSHSASTPTKTTILCSSVSPSSGLNKCETVSRQALADSANEIIEEINNKRKKDSELLVDFKKSLEIHMDKTCSTLENSIFEIYERQSLALQTRLSELFEILERVAKLEEEMSQFKQVLGVFYKDIA